MPRPRAVKYVRSSDLDALVRYLSVPEGRKRVNDTCKYHVTPLMWSTRSGNVDIIKVLLEAGADVNLKDRDGRTALMYAARDGHAAAAELLVLWMAKVDDQDDDGRTALIFAASQNNESVVKVLLRRGATVDLANYENRTALMYACREGSIEVAQQLLDANASVNFSDVHGRVPLVFAIYGNYVNLVMLLISRGANLLQKDQDGWLPLDWAKDKKHHNLINNIEKKIKEMAGKVFVNDTEGVRSLYAKGRGTMEIIEILATNKLPSMKYVFKSGRVPNPWFEWKIDDDADKFPPDFVFPPLTRRQYKF